jgi:ParB/RepB/Spo0J family partition protein
MTAAAPSNMGHHQYIPLAKLTPSPLNHRKRFDEVKLDELVGSVRAQGVIQPILARPLSGDKFEVVAGERRFRAAKKAGLADMPAVVRDLTDEQVLELQMIENSQREDVHPLEEAEGYEALLKCRKDPRIRTRSIALSRSRARAAERSTPAETARAHEGRPPGVLRRHARFVPRAAARAHPAARPAAEGAQGDPRRPLRPRRDVVPGGRRAHPGRVHAGAAWRAVQARRRDLVPAAGACTTCPKRTGTNPELFPDVKSADVCTDPKCFAAKRGAHFVQIKAQAVAKGREVVSGKDARDYVRLDDRCNSDGKYRTYREILGKAAPAKPALMPDTRGDKPKLVDAVRKDEIEAVLEKKGASLPAANATEAREKEQLEQEIGDEVTAPHVPALHRRAAEGAEQGRAQVAHRRGALRRSRPGARPGAAAADEQEGELARRRAAADREGDPAARRRRPHAPAARAASFGRNQLRLHDRAPHEGRQALRCRRRGDQGGGEGRGESEGEGGRRREGKGRGMSSQRRYVDERLAEIAREANEAPPAPAPARKPRRGPADWMREYGEKARS